ncbi:MFS transporter [Dactylosporangium matsuzakiense]|uniref:MFS transporter n=1 Tax=Dactylosporangium matsuzakiense TaxID=53360 RepID=UPI0021C43E5C|nr:MFS transporter [Dactylosporangium matsuzakiense]UWZ45344.1 MFS transporter [Dactylosporangium matsuzakiense]
MPRLPTGALRLLVLISLVNTTGTGLWMVSSAIYLTRFAGLSIAQTGLALTLTGLVGMVASAPMGYVADRLGAREVFVAGLVVQALGTTAFIVVHNIWVYLLIGVPLAVADAAQRGAKGAVIGGAVPPEERVRTRAYLRSVTNVGIAMGSALAGVALAADTRWAYVAMILGDALTYLVAAALATRLDPIPRTAHTPGAPRLTALRDRPFLVFVLLDGLMSTHFGLFEVGLPLWIAHRTDAPTWLVAVVYLTNTTAVVLLQVRAARGTDEPRGAARAARRAGLVLFAACGLYALSGHANGVVTIALLIAGALVHVVGELWHSASGWGISFGLAPADRHGQYQGAYAIGMQLGQMLAPVMVTTLVVGWGDPGWLLLGAAFALAGAAMPPTVGWALRNRPGGADQPTPRLDMAAEG